LITFLYELAGALSRFYGPRENRVIEQSPEIAAILLAILDTVSICLKNGLRLLGMEAPESMTRAVEGEKEDESAGETSDAQT
jgi:arginyl-tRNA synthetase